MINCLRHVLVITAVTLFILGIPFLKSDYFSAAAGNGTMDAVTSASVVLDQPSGNYVVLINKEFHTDTEKMEAWTSFFQGGDVTYIFEDISCSVADYDQGAIDMAKSFMSRLPENQMTVRTEDGTMLRSRVDHGKYDIVIMSEEFAKTDTSDPEYGDGVNVIYVKGGIE